MKKKIWSARIKKRYLLVIYIFSFQSLSRMRWPLQPSQRNHYEKLIITSQIAITFIYSLFASLSRMKRPLRSLHKGSDYYWNEKSSHFRHRLYLFILFLYSYFSQLFSTWNSDSICYLSYDKRNGRCGVEPHAHRANCLVAIPVYAQ